MNDSFVAAVAYTGVGSGIALIVAHFTDLSLPVLLIIIMFINVFTWCHEAYRAKSRLAGRFAEYKKMQTEYEISQLIWLNLEPELQAQWLNKVSDNAPNSELKSQYRHLSEQRSYWEKECLK